MVKQIFKRKEALENKLFKMKYSKLLRTLTDQSRTQIADQRRHPSSIYEENPVDPKVDIPANKYMFDVTIKDAFEIYDSSSDEEEEKKNFYTKSEMFDQCMEIYEDKNPVKVGRVAGPSQRKLNKIDCIEQAKIISKCS